MRILLQEYDQQFSGYFIACMGGTLPLETDINPYKVKVANDFTINGDLDSLCDWVFDDLTCN